MRTFVLGTLALAATASGCGHSPPAGPPAPPPPLVDVARPVVKELVEWDEYLGRLAPAESVEVRARVGGFVDSIHFTDGQLVDRGDLLFVIDPRPYRAALAAADAEVRRLEARLALATNDAARSERLLRTSAISAEEHDTRTKAVDEARAALEGARARREQARLDVEFTEVRAPMSGRASRHLVSVGNLISGGTSQGTLLTTIMAVDKVHAYFDVDEQAFLRYSRLAMAGGLVSARDASTVAQLCLADDPGARFEGVIDFLDSHLDPSTGTLRQRAVVDSVDPRLLPGVFVRVRLPATARRRAVLVPDVAIGTDQTRRFVWIVGQDGLAAARPVTLGRLVDGQRVIEAGLEGDEQVVVRGVQRVRPGAPVTARPLEVAAVTSAALAGGAP